MSIILRELEKHKGINPSVDVDHLLSILNKYKANAWVEPETADDYAVFEELFSYHLICKLIAPIYDTNYNFKGTRNLYRFSHYLNY